MLPILRIVPVGGVLLAILILLLALTPPGGAHPLLSAKVIAARGPLIDRDDHPEWRQFLIHAALRRADELDRLRELPDNPVIVPVAPEIETPGEPASSTAAAPAEAAVPPSAEPVQSAATSADDAEDMPTVVAGLTAEDPGADPVPDSAPAAIEEFPDASAAVETGGASSIETRVVLPPPRPPTIRAPQRLKPAHETQRRIRRPRHARVQPPPPAPTFVDMLFGTTPSPPPPLTTTASSGKPPARSAAAANETPALARRPH
jgi:hypothetical protein